MKKNEYYYHIKDDGSKKLIKALEIEQHEIRSFITYARYENGETVVCRISENRCRQITRLEAMQIAKKRIKDICEEFDLWTGGDGEIECPSAVLICKKTRNRIEI